MNNKCKLLIVFILVFMVATLQVQAEKYKGTIVKKSPKASTNCLTPSRTTTLSLNLVRALLKTNGTMWFREKAEYEVPKGSGKTSMFSASLWIGGTDDVGNIYVSAMTFGQKGQDFWTGPLTMTDATITQATCNIYDRFFPISRIEVERHMRAFSDDGNDESYDIPKSILEWPAISTVENTSKFLAPFRTKDGNDPFSYNPRAGDYPYYDFANELCPWTAGNIMAAQQPPWLDENNNPNLISGTRPNPAALPMPRERIATRQNTAAYGWDNKMIYADHVLKGDATVFWFLNDKGDIHSESGSTRSIGLEIRTQAFAFATNDELNKMTFYSYEIINRGKTTIYNTYFSQWVDPDLGYAKDDFVGCDVNRGLGYCYNGKEIDGGGEAEAYGANPPAVGVDFFQGPYIDADGMDNPKFYKDKASINGTPEQQEYCKKFVHYLIEKWGNNGPTDLSEVHGGKTLEIERDSAGIKLKDTVPLRWNNQFAINGVNFGDGIVDNERFGMRRFVFHVNNDGPTGDPKEAPQYYMLLRGIWRDNTPMTYGGTGYKDGTIVCDFMFPRGTDYCNWGTNGVDPGETYKNGGRTGNWSEESPFGVGSAPNPYDDRRFMQSAGPFTLMQGACNYITVGIPWARASQGGVSASVALLMVADDKCQALFENCFKLIDGPDAPDLTIRELDQKLILFLSNRPKPISNNGGEQYQEEDSKIPRELSWIDKVDRFYRFEGYQIFQVTGPEVGSNDLDNPSLARLVRQYDIVNTVPDPKKPNYKEPIGRLINWEFDDNLQISVPKEKVNGTNSGIEHSFEITQDAFASGNKQLVNYKTYYFIAIAYAYNEYWPFSIDPNADHGLEGQKLPYLRGRKNADGLSVIPVAAVPHPPSLHQTLNSDYGTIPNIVRIDGQGNGGNALDLTQETIDKIVTGGDKDSKGQPTYRVKELKYEKNAGPLSIKVIDPLQVKPFDFTIFFTEKKPITNQMDVSDNTRWLLTIDETVSDSALIHVYDLVDKDGKALRRFESDTTIGYKTEKLIFPLGISLTIKNTPFINRQQEVLANWDRIVANFGGSEYKAKLLFCQSEKIDIANDIVFKNNGAPWITGLADDGNLPLPSNWIRAGSFNLGVWNTNNNLTHSGGVIHFYDEWRLEDAFLPTILITIPGSDFNSDRAFKDFTGKFSTVCGGTWAPYVLTSPYDFCPQAKYVTPEPPMPLPINQIHTPSYYNFNYLQDAPEQPGYNQTMTNLYSVDVVLTNNKALWTRCVVLESCPDAKKSENGAFKNEPRKHKSVNQEGDTTYHPINNPRDGFGPNNDEGMGWFPGYAINLETGERLNIMFSENSDTTLQKFGAKVNGSDMKFNPTATYAMATQDVDIEFDGRPVMVYKKGQIISKQEYDNLYITFDKASNILNSLGIERIWGGMHYVYVCNSAGNTSPIYYLSTGVGNDFLKNPRRNFNLNDTIFKVMTKGPYGGYIGADKKYPYYECGPYDNGQWLVEKFKTFINITSQNDDVRKKGKMQVFNNVMYTHIPMLPIDPDLQKQFLSSDVVYKIRVTRPYMRYISRWYESPDDRTYNTPDNKPDDFVQYKGYPVYQFSTKNLAPTANDSRSYQSVLDNINIVPNPYYGSSLYEGKALETMIKITNLPTNLKNNAPVTINIYTVSGILVRTLTKGDNNVTYVNWDLKNFANIPIAGGVYIIHVNCPGIGERTLKFFCAMRATDLNAF